MLKKLVLFVAAVMLLASSAQAELNQIITETWTPPIMTGTTGETGSLTLKFNAGTKLQAGDVISGLVSEGVVVTKGVDFYVRFEKNATVRDVANTNGTLFGSGINATNLLFHVVALEGKRDVSVRVMNGTLQTSLNPADSASLILFNERNATEDDVFLGKAPEGWTWSETDGHFHDKDGKNASAEKLIAISPDENILCVAVGEKFSQPYVRLGLTVSSKAGTSFNFAGAGSSPTIAEVKPATITPVDLKDAQTFKLGGGQASACSVDYELGTTFCKPWKTGVQGYVALNGGSGFPVGEYVVTAEVLVDGAVGTKGAYFGGAVSKIEFVEDMADLYQGFSGGAITLAPKDLYLGDGKVAMSGASCNPKDSSKVVKVVSTGTVVKAEAQKQFLRFDIPTIYLVESDLPKGAKVGVRITVEKGCGKFVSADYSLFTVVEKCKDAPAAAGGALLFPYFADAPFWNGMALTNIGNAPVNASLAIVDEKGGKGSIDIMVPANGMYVNLVEKIIADSAFKGTVDKALRCYITVTPQSGSLVGFAMMGNAGESMGYTVNNN